jgi:hypothetical protein
MKLERVRVNFYHEFVINIVIKIKMCKINQDIYKMFRIFI